MRWKSSEFNKWMVTDVKQSLFGRCDPSLLSASSSDMQIIHQDSMFERFGKNSAWHVRQASRFGFRAKGFELEELGYMSSVHDLGCWEDEK